MMKEELEADIRAERIQEWLQDQPKCKQCGELWNEDSGIYDEECDEYYCNQDCKDVHDYNRAESAYHKQFEGEGPVTAQEIHERDAKAKREQR